MTRLFSALIILICLTLISYGQTDKIYGKIIDSRTGQAINDAKVELTTVFIKGGKYPSYSILYDTIYSLVKRTKTNQDGVFNIDSLESLIYKIECGKWLDSLGYRFVRLNLNMESSDSIYLDVKLPEYCPFHTQNNRNGICPICEKTDSVIPILYGEPTLKALEKVKNGELYLGGCSVDDYCQANWYCKNDSLAF